mgnify:CR=1 FL=1
MIFVSTYNFVPLFINVKDLKVLIVGGGKIGTKRALSFTDHGSNVTVVSLSFSKDLIKNKDKITLIKEDAKNLTADFLSKFDIIITATNDKELNKKLCELAKNERKLCNNPTNSEDSNFIVPIYYSDNKLSIAITTFGKSSLTSKYILKLIQEEILTKDIYELITAMGYVKDLLKRKITDPSQRFSYYSKIFNDEIFRNYVKEGKLDFALDRAKALIDE